MPSICVKRTDGEPLVMNGEDEASIWIEGIELYEDEDEVFSDHIIESNGAELEIVDFDDFLGLKAKDVDRACELAKFIVAHGEALVGYIQIHGEHYYENIHSEAYMTYPADKGDHATMTGKEVFGWTMFEEQFGEVPNWLIHAVDWDKAAEEYIGGDCSTHEGSDGTFYVYEEN